MPLPNKNKSGITARNNAIEPTQQDVQKLIDLFNSGDLSEAEKQGYRLLKSFPSSFAVSNILAGTLFTLKKWSPAIALYDEALAINPNYEIGRFNQAVAYEELNNLDEAIRHYSDALEINSELT